ncbi:MAG: hypothetical protein Kow0042_24720 [Calditrichia bacterium]
MFVQKVNREIMGEMKSKIFLLLIILSGWLVPGLRAQYVRTETYPTERERRMRYALDDWLSYMQTNHVNSIAVGTNYIYFGTLDGGILRYQLFQNYWDYPFTTSNGLPSNRVLTVAYDQGTGYLWAITESDNRIDTCIFKPAEQEWLCQAEADYWPYTFPGVPTGPDTGIGYNVFYPREKIYQLPSYFADGGYTLTGDWIILDEHFDEFPVTGFLRDNWERMWFVIEGLGMGIGNTMSQRLKVVPLGLTEISPRTLQYQYDDLWIAGEPRQGREIKGIVRWRDDDGGWEYYQARWIANLPSDNVADIEVTGDSVWFATDWGVSLFNIAKNEWKNFSVREGLFNQVVQDLQVCGSKLYIGTIQGLNVLDLSSGLIKRIKDKPIHLATIYQLACQQDTVWAATNRGILRFRSPSQGWEAVPIRAAIQDLPTLSVEVFEDEVWFTSPGGVFWYNTRADKWESFPQIGMELQGPFSDLAVNAVSVWVSTPEGLLKFDRERHYWRLFTVEDGLLDNECHRLLLDGDFIWVANRSGITQFYWNNPHRID